MVCAAACVEPTPRETDAPVGETVVVERVKVRDSTRAPQDIAPPDRVFANERFKEVRVQRTSGSEFLVQGKAQVFEASFSWVVEDGHEQLNEGHAMTDAGAPEWGNFQFTVNVVKARPNSTLTLILFEYSAKDGSRQFELPIAFVN